MLSILHGIYDPMGLAGPPVMNAKKLFQESCKLKIDWNTEVPENLKILWQNWYNSLPTICKLQIDRCYKPLDNN